MSEQQIDVVLAVAQGGNPDLRRAQTEIKVLPELAAADSLVKVDVRGRDDADIGMFDLVGSHLAVLPGLEHAEQQRLRLQRKLGDFVQEKRAAVGVLKIAFTGFRRACERAFYVSEKLGIHEFLGEGAAVHDEEIVVPAVRILMDYPCRFQRLIQGRIVADDVVFVFQCL